MIWAMLLSAVSLAAPPQVVVDTLDGRELTGSLSEYSATQLVVETAEGAVTVPAEQLLSLAPQTPPARPEEPPPVLVFMADGSEVRAADYAAADGKATLTRGGKTTEVSLNAITRVRFQEPTPQIAEQWREILRDAPAADLIVQRKGDSIDFLDGVIRDVDAENVHFEVSGQVVPVKRQRVVAGLVYYRPRAPRLPDPKCIVTDAAGSKLRVREVAWQDGQLQLETLGGLSVQVPWEQAVGLDFSAGKLEYLTAIEPESLDVQAWVKPPIDSLLLWRHPRKNNWGVSRGKPLPLSLHGVTYSRGLALRSRTELLYRLRGRFSRFTALAGIDDAMEGAGHVRLVITGDDKTLFAGDISGQDEAPHELDLDVSGVSRLEILVDYGEDGDRSDFLNLCNARLIK